MLIRSNISLAILTDLYCNSKYTHVYPDQTRGFQPSGRVPVLGLETGSGGTQKNSILTSPVMVIANIPV